MQYAMLLKAHPNVRYEQSLQKLAQRELCCSLKALGLKADTRIETVAGESLLCFDLPELTPDEWRVVSDNSCVCLAGVLEGESIRLLERQKSVYLPRELPQILKYKGKTNADFTELMINCARNASSFAKSQETLTVLDPLCGKGTTLFCAIVRGYNAIGVERDEKAIRESDAYLERFLTMNRLKHKRRTYSRTLREGAAKGVGYELADSAESWRSGNMRTLDMLCADVSRLDELVKPQACHIAVADMPYGVQHAPGEGRGMSTMTRLISALGKGLARALKQGGAAALSFNAYTLKREEAADALSAAGLTVLDEPPHADFRHWVEQAVDRDVIFAVRHK